MRIVCPACAATYEVPDALLAAGPRQVRCAKCGHEWMPPGVAPAPPQATAEPQAALAVPETPVPDVDPQGRYEPRLRPLRPRPEGRLLEAPLPAEPERPPAGRSAVPIIAWALTLLVLAAFAGAAVAWRSEVMAAWPPSERVYAALGLR